MPDNCFFVVLNPNAGTALAGGLSTEQLVALFEEAGCTATSHPVAGASISEQTGGALESGVEVIVAGGGDGTVTALAEAVAGTDKTLVVLPLGTANLLARDLGIPLDLHDAIAALPHMQPRSIDMGEVNGRPFLHNVTIGFAPRLAVKREQMRGRGDLASKLRFLRMFVRNLLQARRMAVEIRPREGEARVERVRSITIANNAYSEGVGRIFTRQRLDAGQLTLYLVRRLTVRDFLRLCAGMLAGRWRQDRVLAIESVSEVTIRLKRQTVLATVDGEVETLSVPLHFRILPRALRVMAPVPQPETDLVTQAPAAAGG